MSHNVYQVLNVADESRKNFNPGRSQFENTINAALNQSSDKWLIQSCREDGLNVYYQLMIVYPKGSEFYVSLPWLAQQSCTHCQGQGVNYAWNKDNSSYEPTPCPECGGEGLYQFDSEIDIAINDAVEGLRVIRKRRAGHLNTRLGLRGDLILGITWVDELPDNPVPWDNLEKSMPSRISQ